MDIRKLLTSPIADGKWQKKNNFSSDSKCEVSQTLSNTSLVIKSFITDYLSGDEQRKMAEVNKDFYQCIQSKVTNKPCFYYAVGSNIDLANDSRFIKELCISENHIKNSLQKNFLLFSDYHTAKNYAYLRRVNYYHQEFDAFLPLAEPAVFIVRLFQDGLYNKIATKTQVTQHIPECPAPPAAQTMHVFGFKAAPHKIKIYYSYFNGRLFSHNTTHGRFSSIWSQAISVHNDLQKSAVAGVLAIFNSYFRCYSTFTRHNQELVREILDKTIQSPSIEELHDFIASAYQEGMNNNAINKNGHYMQMLNFVNTELNLLRNLNKLPGINDYIAKPDF